MARFRLALPVIAAIACACGSAQKPYSPFKIPRESFYPGLKIVALAPLRLPSDLEDPEPVRARFAELVSWRLRTAGLAVVPASDVEPIVAAKSKEVGGVFDPVTGKADEAKAKALDAAIGRELKARFNADAFLDVGVRVVNDALVRDEARWPGGRGSQHSLVRLGGGHPDRDKGLHGEHARGMTDRDEFLAWVKSSLYQAEFALHNGDPAPRRALWSRRDPVSVLGAWRNAHGQAEIEALFAYLGRSFSNCTSYVFEVQAFGVVGDMAYTAGLERTAVSVDGKPRIYTLRVTQVYRREDGEWKVVHRHGDTVTE